MAAAATIVAFSFALGVSNVALPLAALQAGYGLGAIGALSATSALAQLAVRATVSRATRRFTDRALIGGACCLLLVCCAVLVWSTAPAAFVAAQLAQGAGRGYFWTGSQLHAVRTAASSRRGLARVNLIASVGMLTGPVAAGAFGDRSPGALAIAAVVAAAGVAAASLMTRLPLLEPARAGSPVAVWKRADIRSTGWGSASTGAWTALIVSFVPVLLAEEHPTLVVGVLIAVANASSIAGSVAVGWARQRQLAWLFRSSLVAIGAGVALLPPAAASAALCGGLLIVSGLGAGALLTLSPALAIDSVHGERRAEALAVTGSFRAGALLVTPLAVAGAVVLMPLSAALAAVGATIAAVAARRPPDASPAEDARHGAR